jgi:hypothetical protein
MMEPSPMQPMNQPMRRNVPSSDLDFNMQLTNTVWGSDLITPELRDLLAKEYYVTDDKGAVVLTPDGKPLLKRESLWAIHSYYTRDLRLGNLDRKDAFEFKYCVHYLDLAGDMLKTGMLQPFVICISRVATMLELSQSRGGFLRKEMNTLRSENKQELLEPAKKSLFGGKPKE